MTISTKDRRCLQYKQALVKVKNKNKTKPSNLPAISLLEPHLRHTKKLLERTSYLSSNFLVQMGDRKISEWTLNHAHQNSLLGLACLDFTYEYSCLLQMEFFFLLFIFFKPSIFYFYFFLKYPMRSMNCDYYIIFN